MMILKERSVSEPTGCPYLEDRLFVQEYFFARGFSEEELDKYLKKGWRRFGMFFFRPSCPGGCRECQPIRILTEEFEPTRSQKRNLKKNEATRMVVGVPEFSERHWDIYSAHKKFKFGEEADRSGFEESFYLPVVPALQTEYFVEETLAGVGYLDVSSQALSSVYFSYDPDYASLGLGVFSVLSEINLALKMGLPYYNLGYYIATAPRMNYKGNYSPFECMDWKTEKWLRGDKKTVNSEESTVYTSEIL